jgi:hypothetical protein
MRGHYNIFLIAMANTSSLRGSLTVQGKVVPRVRVWSLLMTESLTIFFPLTRWPPNLRVIAEGNIQFSGSACSRANTATLELNVPLYCPPSHVFATHRMQTTHGHWSCVNIPVNIPDFFIG